MQMVCSNQDILHHIRPGDITAFGGYDLLSRWSKFTTRSNVTHVAVVTLSALFSDDSEKIRTRSSILWSLKNAAA